MYILQICFCYFDQFSTLYAGIQANSLGIVEYLQLISHTNSGANARFMSAGAC